MYRVILLDIDNTLLDFHAGAQDALSPAFAEQGLAFRAEYMPIFHEINDALWRQIEDGSMTREQLYAVRFHRIFARLGIKGDGDRAESTFRRALAESAVPVAGAHALLRHLYPRYMLCAASNSIHAQQVRRLRLAGMLPYFTHIFTSEKLGYAKPAPDFFSAILSRLGGISPRKTLLVGDSLTADIRGGIDCGIPTCWYNPQGKSAPLDCRPDLTVSRLADLHEIL